MSQSVWRHVQSSGNTHNYLNFRELIRMLLATAFQPVADVPTAFELLQGVASEERQPIFNYSEDIYWYAGFKDDRCPDLTWSNGVAIKSKNDTSLTNNAVEGWNSNFVKLVNSKHPSFPKLIENFQAEQKNAELLLEKIRAGQKSSQTQKG